MEAKCKTHLILGVILLLLGPAIVPGADLWANEDSKYLDAVREFADNVLKYGRDTYGPKHTPLFVDGLNVNTHEPVKWINPDGYKWVLSNFASQQTLMRTLDGLSEITGDPKYRTASVQAIRYAFDNLRTPSGLFYWGQVTAYDALGDGIQGSKTIESIKLHYPYYELMWKVDPIATKKLIEALWSAHVIDWSSLDFNRIASTAVDQGEPWDHEYNENGPTFFNGSGGGFFSTGTSLIQAGSNLYILSGREKPLSWSKRLAKRFFDTRHPKTEIKVMLYNSLTPSVPLGSDLKEHFTDPRTTYFPILPFEKRRYLYYPENTDAQELISLILVGRMLGDNGKEFTNWALEELSAWAKASYRKKDNSFVPILTDGTYIEGYVCKRTTTNAQKGEVVKALFVDLSFFWGYAMAYSETGDEFMWQMVRDIALGNGFGDIGETLSNTIEPQTNTTCSNVYGLLGFLELYAKTGKIVFLNIARQIGDNILVQQFHKGFFVPSKRHIYSRFDCFEPLALLHLYLSLRAEVVDIPRVWPSIPLFVPPYRYKQEGVDRLIIYNLTEFTEPPLSLQEVAAIGDINKVRILLDNGVDVNSWDDSQKKTALQRAVLGGHRDVVELLLAKGARIDAKEDFPGGTALHYAAEKGYKEIIALLIDSGADINAGSAVDEAETPFQYAAYADNREIVELLLQKGATIANLHIASYMGDLEKAETFINEGININALDGHGYAPLHYAAQNNQKQAVELLITEGTDVNVKNWSGQTPLYLAIIGGYKDIVEILLNNRADAINVVDNSGDTSLHYCALGGQRDLVELFIAKGLDVDVKNKSGESPLYVAISQGFKDVAEVLISKGANINTANSRGDTALHRAVRIKRKDIAELLIDKGADIDIRNNLGSRPIDLAIRPENKDIIKLLVSKGANINVTNLNGENAICFLARWGRIGTLKYLIDLGADINIRNKSGQTPLDIAVSQGNAEIAELLRKYGAKEEGEEEKASENTPAPKEDKQTDPNAVGLKDFNSAGSFGRGGGLRPSLVLSALF